MWKWRQFFLKLNNFFRRERAERELAREVDSHLALIEEEFRSRGMSPDEARIAARRAFGGVEQAKELQREERSFLWLEQAQQDLRFAFRTLGNNRGFTLVAVLTLALGIGANSAIFSVIDTLLLRRPAFEHLDRLVYILDSNPQQVPADVEATPSPGNFLDWREQVHSFDRMAAWRNWYYTLSGSGDHDEPESVRGVRISPSFFDMIGVKVALGRTFLAEEEQPGRGQVVILSDSLWRRRFGADPAIAGRRVLIDGQPLEVIGVLPADFRFYQSDFDLWMPLTVDGSFQNRQNHSIMAYGRLGEGVSLEQAEAEMKAIAHRLEQAHPDTNAGWGVRLVPVYPGFEARSVRPALLILLGAASFVLLIACANVANLLLSRAVARQREITIRAAVGASRSRLIRQMLTESILLAVTGGAAALVFAHWGIELLIPLLPHASVNKTIGGFRAASAMIDARTLVFSLVLALTAAIVFGLVPAFQTTRPDSLRAFGSSSRRPAIGRLLMVAEIALSVVLLVGAALLLQSFWRLQTIDPGFRSDHLLTMQIWLPKTKYPEAPNIRNFYEQLIRRVEVLPAVQAAGAVSYRPFNGIGVLRPFDIEGRAPPRPDDIFIADYRVVTPGYTRMLGQRLVTGRDFVEGDRPDSAGVAIINEAMAQHFFPNEDPIGKHIRPAFEKTDTPWDVDAPLRWLTIVGVVSNIKELRLDEESRPELYVSYRQFPSSFMFLMVRTVTPPESLVGAIQNAVRTIDQDQPVSNVQTMDQAISTVAPRFNVQVLGVFAVVAMLLSAVGVYGVTSYAIGQRQQEIAVRMALGARTTDVLMMVVREGLRLGAIGVGAGIVLANLLTRTMASLLYGVSPTDTTTFAAASVIVLGITLAACYLPARKAARVDPMTTLRTT